MSKRRILVIFGTRPEAIKMAPLIHELQKNSNCIEVNVCVTAQHRQMLDQVLESFGINVDFDLDLMLQNQSLSDLTSRLIAKISLAIEKVKPDLLLVHGDTTTTLAGALAGFYNGCLVGHVEAGLRTGNFKSPFPEEMNRQLVSKLADYHYAPTEKAQVNLLTEGIVADKIFNTGNTVIDALHQMLEIIDGNRELLNEIEAELYDVLSFDCTNTRVVLITAHRRENHGQGIINICNALCRLAILHPNVKFVYPVHLNPRINEPVHKILDGIENIHLCRPLDYKPFIYLMSKCYIVLTDSGGIQEEAPSLGKPVLVLRDTTERPEAVESGTVKLIGTQTDGIVDEVNKLIQHAEIYTQMSLAVNPYGDGKASKRITDHITSELDC